VAGSEATFAAVRNSGVPVSDASPGGAYRSETGTAREGKKDIASAGVPRRARSRGRECPAPEEGRAWTDVR